MKCAGLHVGVMKIQRADVDSPFTVSCSNHTSLRNKASWQTEICHVTYEPVMKGVQFIVGGIETNFMAIKTSNLMVALEETSEGSPES